MPRHVAIIGAGPAGSVAAILLGRGGCEVTLIEQHRFPRDKVCGECLSADGIAVLERLGISAKVMDLGATVFTHTAVHSSDGRSARLQLPRPMWGLSRSRFDAFLLETARATGARVRQPARCEAVLPGARPSLRVRMLESNDVVGIEADQAIVADGKGSLLRGTSPTGDFGIKAHFEQVDGPRDTIELFGCRGMYGGLAAVEGGRWNAAFSVPAGRLRSHRGDLAKVFKELVGENPTLKQHMTGARQVTDWIASPLPRFGVRNHWPSDVIPAGNAAAAIEPIGGEGMGLALRSAEIAASEIMGTAGRAIIGQYRQLWVLRRPACRAAAVLVCRPTLARWIATVLRISPWLGNAGLRLLGK